jgi:drug/metabolite transporter (DMT)-like permease
MRMMIAVVGSLLAALLYAVASVLQHRAAISVSVDRSMRLGLLAKLIAKPWWVAGVAADGLAFVMQFIALGHGPLVVVQPLLVTGLLFALPLGAWVSGRRFHPADIRAAVLVVAGLGVFLLAANPARGTANLTSTRWALLFAGTVVPVGVLVLLARNSVIRPGLLAAGAAWIYGLTAALAKAASHELDVGVVHALTSWEVWALVPGGLLGMVLVQSAFQAGPLKASLPTLTVVDPLVSIGIGVLAFKEHLDISPLNVVLEVASTAAMIWGVFVLGRSPLVALDEPDVGPAGDSEQRSDDGVHHP